MTIRKWSKLYEHFRNFYDFKLQKVSYKEIRDQEEKRDKQRSGEWLPF